MAPRVSRFRYPQIAREPLLTSKSRANPENRVLAKGLDYIICVLAAWALSFVWSPVIYLLPLIFWSSADRFGRGQSPGKWLLGLHTIETIRGEKISVYQGLIRNFPFFLGTIGLWQLGWVWLALMVPAAGCVLMEAYFVFSLRSGSRVGDVLSNTRVADFKDEHTQFIEQFLKEEESL